METMYVLWNYDIDEPIMASTDKSLLEEFICDIFMDDYSNDCNWECYQKKSPPTKETLAYIADENWYGVLDFYNTYLDIVESPVIE